MKKSLLLLALLSTCGLPPPAYSQEKLREVNYPTLFLLQWTYQCSQQMQPQFLYRGMPQHLALQFSIQQCSCVIDKFREHYRYEQVLDMDEGQKLSAADQMTKKCMIGVNTDRST